MKQLLKRFVQIKSKKKINRESYYRQSNPEATFNMFGRNIPEKNKKCAHKRKS